MSVGAIAKHTASCACGQLRARCAGAPVLVSACACADCRRRTGSAFGVAAFFAAETVSREGETKTFTRPSDSGYPVEHHFCPECGATVFWLPRRKPGLIAIGWGAFADRRFPPPTQAVRQEGLPDWCALDLNGLRGDG